MSAVSLPTVVEPFKWADRAVHVMADVPLSTFSRLSEGALDPSVTVHVDCRFERDAQHVSWLRGRMEVSMRVACQRCLEPVALPLEVDLDLALLREEAQADRLPDDADFLVVDEHDVSLADILEDELLLAVPYTPVHDACELGYAPAAPEKADVRKENPFQVLAALKKPSAKE